MDFPTATLEEARRLEVVVDGLPLHGGAQLAVDTTLVSVLHVDQGGALLDGVALLAARKRKEQICPEFPGARCRVAGFHARQAGSSLNSRGPVPGARLRS